MNSRFELSQPGKRVWTLAGIFTLTATVSFLLGIAGNIASDHLPSCWEPYLWLVWPISGALILIAAALSFRQSVIQGIVITRRQRRARLEDLFRASRARCIERWQAAGVSIAQASELADDTATGAIGFQPRMSANRSLLVLVGDVGSGKSLIADRLFQTAIRDAQNHARAPVPVYLDARMLERSVQDEVEAEAFGLGNARIRGATVIVDEGDVSGTDTVLRLIAQARVLVQTWPKTRVVITSRPYPALSQAEEAAQIRLLSDIEAYTLISRLAGRAVTPNVGGRWPRSLREAVNRPLFAVLLGVLFREEENEVPQSTGELLSGLVERCLGLGRVDNGNATELLRRIAVLSTNRGGAAVPAPEVAPRDELQPLLDSGLIGESSRGLRFELSILREWFAAQGLARGDPAIEDVMTSYQLLEHWRYPLVIAVGTYEHAQVSQLLRPLTERHPAFAAEVVSDALTRPEPAEETVPPPPRESGQRVRTAMQAWATGIGQLTELTAPVRDDGSLLPMGASVEGLHLTVVWFSDNRDLPDVEVLPQSFSARELPRFIRMTSTRVGHHSAWAWRWTLDQLAEKLSDLLGRRALPVDAGPLADEAVWRTALAVTGRGSLDPRPLPVAEIEDRLVHLGQDDTVVIDGEALRVGLLRAELTRLQEAGERELRAPWPLPDRGFRGGGWIWELYSPDQLVALARAVYAGAVEGYQGIVDTWFPGFAERLGMATVLPARLVGALVLPGNDRRFGTYPSLSWYLEPRPVGSLSTVDIRLRKDHIPMSKPLLRWETSRVRNLRPEAPQWLAATLHFETLEVFPTNPVTELVYRWLWKDLSRVSWAQRGFH